MTNSMRWEALQGIGCALLLAAVACGSDSTADRDAAAGGDGAVADAGDPAPDAAACPAPEAGAIGGACGDDVDCGEGAGDFCFDEGEAFPPAGYCSRADCDENATCGDGAFCATITGPGVGPERPPGTACLAECCEGDVCAAGLLCQGTLMGIFRLSDSACLPGNAAAADHDACDHFGDCNANSTCMKGLEAPGGMCATMGCTPGDDTTCAPVGDATCIARGGAGIGICMKKCQQDDQCRQEEGYRCRPLGFTGGCMHPRVGDICLESYDCGITPWMCLTGWPGGYCTVRPCEVGVPESCPEGTVCRDPDGGGPDAPYCLKLCEGIEDCRAGYNCQNIGAGRTACVPAG